MKLLRRNILKKADEVAEENEKKYAERMLMKLLRRMRRNMLREC